MYVDSDSIPAYIERGYARLPAGSRAPIVPRPRLAMRSCPSFVRILLAALAVAVSASRAQEAVMTVPLRPATGFGPFSPVVHVSLPGDNGGVWQRAQAEVRGIPVDIHGFSLRYLNMQMDQYVYQSYREGLIDPAIAHSVIAGRMIDTAKLSLKHVTQDIPIVAGYDGDGNRVFLVDTRDNHSFWGEERIVVPPVNTDALSDARMDSLNSLFDRPVAQYEIFDGSKIRELSATIRLWPYVRIPLAEQEAFRGRIVFGVCVYEHRRGLLTAAGRTWVIDVSNGFLSGVYGGKQDSFALYPARDTLDLDPASTLRYGLGDRVAIGDSLFEFRHVTVDGSSLTLAVKNATAGVGNIAVGSKAPEFGGRTLAGDTVRLRDLRGMFVLLVFWRPGSAASEAAIPYLNDVQQAWGGGNLRVIGMPLREGQLPGDIASARGIGWTQIPVDDTAGVLRDYFVLGYPAAYLIDGNGRIAANERLGKYWLSLRLADVLKDSASFPAYIGKGNVEFRYDAANDAEVGVAGDFTGWLPLPMYRSGDVFSRHAAIPAGTHSYRFWVNGGWKLDPANNETSKDSLGQVNSVITVH